jgi:hypothetical protein
MRVVRNGSGTLLKAASTRARFSSCNAISKGDSAGSTSISFSSTGFPDSPQPSPARWGSPAACAAPTSAAGSRPRAEQSGKSTSAAMTRHESCPHPGRPSQKLPGSGRRRSPGLARSAPAASRWVDGSAQSATQRPPQSRPVALAMRAASSDSKVSALARLPMVRSACIQSPPTLPQQKQTWHLPNLRRHKTRFSVADTRPTAEKTPPGIQYRIGVRRRRTLVHGPVSRALHYLRHRNTPQVFPVTQVFFVPAGFLKRCRGSLAPAGGWFSNRNAGKV